jgi:hypothetical protein
MRKTLVLTLLTSLLVACGTEGSPEWGPCTSSNDCAGDLVCNSGVCLQPEQQVSCLVDEQCPEGFECLNGVCSDGNEPPPECTDANPCGKGFSCVKGHCVDNGGTDLCQNDDDCKDGEACEAGQCVETAGPECTDNEGCESGNCDVKAGVCLGAICEEDGDCLEGTCDLDSGTCTLPDPGCEIDDDCKSGLCDSGTGECIENAIDCEGDGECDDEDPCTDDSCQEGKCKNVHAAHEGCCLSADDCEVSGLCEEASCVDFACVIEPIADCCSDPTQCDDGNPMTSDLCTEGVCKNPGIDCVFDADCDDGNPCSIDTCPSSHQCENTATADPLCCTTDEDCDDDDPDTKDVCLSFQCQFKSENCVLDVDCVDSNPCTTETCNQGTCLIDTLAEPQCACEADGDCIGKGNTCVLEQIGPISMGLFCSEPVGSKLAGENCVEDADCRSGLCANFTDGSICFGGCKSDMDCKGISTCGMISIDLGGGQTLEISGCTIPAAGCSGDKSCAGGEVCLAGIDQNMPNTIVGFCGPPVGSKTGGSICSNNLDCQTGSCFELFEKGIDICWSKCSTDDDCLDGLYCYPNLLYYGFDQDTPDESDDKFDSPGTCAPFLGSFQNCWADVDCPGNEFCNWYSNKDWTALEPRCISSKGSIGAGGNCSADNQCKSDYCVTPAGFCMGLCKSSGECTGGTTCEEYPDFEFNPMGDVVTLHLCWP